MRDQTDNLTKNIGNRRVCVRVCQRERETERVLLAVRSGRRMRQDGLPNIRRVGQTEAAAHSLLTVKLLGVFLGLKVEKMVGVLPNDDCCCIGTLLKSCRLAVFVCSRLD